MTQSTPTEAWLKEGLHFKACRINGEAYVELFEGKNCLALIKTYASERKEWWPGIYEDACKEAERLNEQLRSRGVQRERSAPDEQEWAKTKRDAALAYREAECGEHVDEERKQMCGVDFSRGFDAAVNLIARPLLWQVWAKGGYEKDFKEELERRVRIEKERDSARAEAASLRAEITSYREFIANQAKYARRVSDAKACLEILAKLKAGRKEG